MNLLLQHKQRIQALEKKCEATISKLTKGSTLTSSSMNASMGSHPPQSIEEESFHKIGGRKG